MSFYHGPTIVTRGLVLSLDAADKNSYPGSGTTWMDMSGNGNNGTLTNGPTFDSSNGGSIVFDGTNDYVTFPTGFLSQISNTTINFWFYWTDNQSWSRVFDFGTGTTKYMFFTPKNGNSFTPRFAITDNFSSSERQITSNSGIATNTWYYYTITMNNSGASMYANGAYVSNNTTSPLTPSSLGSTNQNWLGRSQFSDPYFQGRIANFSIYNRVLSDSEILQNYNVLKSRFGL